MTTDLHINDGEARSRQRTTRWMCTWARMTANLHIWARVDDRPLRPKR